MNEVGEFINKAFANMTAVRTAAALNAAGCYALKDAKGYAGTVYPIGDDAMKTLLKEAGYAADKVDGLFGAVKNKVDDTANKGWTAFKHAFGF